MSEEFGDEAENGKIYHKCKNCGSHYDYSEAHPCDKGGSGKEDDGIDYRYCTKCGKFYDEDGGHNCKKGDDIVRIECD